VFFDFQLLIEPSIGGTTQAIIAIDDRSEFISVLGSKSKDRHDVMDSLEQVIATYNSRGHLQLLSDYSILHITHTTPDAHCHKFERAIQQIDQKAIAILEALPYFLPSKLILYLKKYSADCINLTCSSTQHPAHTPYVAFHCKKPKFNSDPIKALLPFGAVCLIKHTEGQRAALAAKLNLNLHHVSKASIGVNLGFCHHHPGDNLFYSPPSKTALLRNNFEVVSILPFNWRPKPVLQQTYIQHISPTYEDILLRNDYPQLDKAVDQLSAPTDTQNLLPPGVPTAADFPVSDDPPSTAKTRRSIQPPSKFGTFCA